MSSFTLSLFVVFATVAADDTTGHVVAPVRAGRAHPACSNCCDQNIQGFAKNCNVAWESKPGFCARKSGMSACCPSSYTYESSAKCRCHKHTGQTCGFFSHCSTGHCEDGKCVCESSSFCAKGGRCVPKGITGEFELADEEEGLEDVQEGPTAAMSVGVGVAAAAIGASVTLIGYVALMRGMRLWRSAPLEEGLLVA
mmetsp:Transcript_94087/g.265723  ORF Transcript_94087/g.265723 Transcript_94087/m.265723 type:complete len:197 (+) Transcript_94087:129-719(+)